VLDMDNINEVIETISIGLFIASFLLNTYRVPNAIDLCHECLRVFKNHAGILEDELAILISKAVYRTKFKAYYLIDDYTNAIKCGTELYNILRTRGERTEECAVSIVRTGDTVPQSKKIHRSKGNIRESPSYQHSNR